MRSALASSRTLSREGLKMRVGVLDCKRTLASRLLVPAQQLAGGVQDLDRALEEAHRDLAVRGGGQCGVVGTLDLNEPGVVHGARGLLEVPKALKGQGL